MLDGTAVEKIAELATSERIQSSKGHDFHISDSGASLLKYPTKETLKCFSLSQFVNALSDTIDYIESESFIIVNIESHDRVIAITDIANANWQLEKAILTDFSGIFETFPFKIQMSQEEFIINLQTKFSKTENLVNLMKMVANIKQERVQFSDDDGVSQVAATRSGVHLSSSQVVQSMWTLKTYKTFPEVEQPEIPYILRLHQKEDEMPKFALYECDGGMWKVATTLAVREWLINRIKSTLGEDADRVKVL